MSYSSSYQRTVGSSNLTAAREPVQVGQASYSASYSSQPIQQSSSQSASFIINGGSNFEGRAGELSADQTASLKWASELNNGVVLTGSSDYSRLATLRNALLELRSNFFSANSGLSVKGEQRDELDRRFLLIEHEIEGLLRRRVEYSAKDLQGGERTLDYSSVMHERESYIVELEKRVENLEERLRRAEITEKELQEKIAALQRENYTLRDKSYTGEKLEDALRRQTQFDQNQKDLEAYRANFAAAASLWNHQLSQLSAKYPNDRFALTPELTALLQKSNVITYNTNGVTTLAYARDRNIPVLEGRTKHFFGLLVLNLRKLSEKYPQIRGELDAEVL